jgi:hypothetical protein
MLPIRGNVVAPFAATVYHVGMTSRNAPLAAPPGFTLGPPPTSGVYLWMIVNGDESAWYPRVYRGTWTVTEGGAWARDAPDGIAAPEPRADEFTTARVLLSNRLVCWREATEYLLTTVPPEHGRKVS